MQSGLVQLLCANSIGDPVEFQSWRIEQPNNARCFVGGKWHSLGNDVYRDAE